MKFMSLLVLVAMLGMVGCSSSKKAEPVVEKARTFQKDYVVIDASDGVLPKWIKSVEKRGTAKQRKKNHFFIIEASEQAAKDICRDEAKANVQADIAGQIATFIKKSYGSSVQGGTDEGITRYMEKTLAAETQAFIVGANASHKFYWEKRRYKESLGAEEDKTLYNCFVVAKMKKKDLEYAIKQAKKKLLSQVDDPEVKEKTKKALAYAEKKFAAE